MLPFRGKPLVRRFGGFPEAQHPRNATSIDDGILVDRRCVGWRVVFFPVWAPGLPPSRIWLWWVGESNHMRRYCWSPAFGIAVACESSHTFVDLRNQMESASRLGMFFHWGSNYLCRLGGPKYPLRRYVDP